jgi:hypothetical protein
VGLRTFPSLMYAQKRKLPSAASQFEAGLAPLASYFCKPHPWGLPFGPASGCPRLAPGEFVFACPKKSNPKTNRPGADLDARSAPAGFAPGKVRISGHPDGALTQRGAGLSQGRQKARPYASVAARDPSRAPSGSSGSSRRCSGAPYGTIQQCRISEKVLWCSINPRLLGPRNDGSALMAGSLGSVVYAVVG